MSNSPHVIPSGNTHRFDKENFIINNTLRSGPIGVFDSGAGGLSIARAIRAQLPNEHILYLADTQHAPYGSKPTELVTERAEHITRFLITLGAKLIVVACNTATVTSIKHLRTQFEHTTSPCPIVGVEPGIKLAHHIMSTTYPQNRKLGITANQTPLAVLATHNTLKTTAFRKLITTHTTHSSVILQPCPGFVEVVESGNLADSTAFNTVTRILNPLLRRHINTFILGCTHFDFLAETFSKAANQPIQLIQTHEPVAKQVFNRLKNNQIINPLITPPRDHFFCTTTDPLKINIIERAYSKLWGANITMQCAEI
ncbi:MAG: glutamate racemase [Gammaproteobacteria bacterium]